MNISVLGGVASFLLLLFTAVSAIHAQSGAKNGEWRTYGGDLGHTRYAPLDQINAANFSTLEVAWRFKTDHLGPRPEFQFEGTPLMAGGIIYATAGTRRAVVALDAVTGEQLWMHSEQEGQRGSVAPRQLSGRGLAYWTDGREERILYVTPGYRLVALDAKTGYLVPGFGKNGIVDLKTEMDQTIDPLSPEIGLHSTPIVARDVVIVGAAHKSGGVPTGRRNIKGYVRGFDVKTGKRLWIFHTIPSPGEFGNDTWEKDSWSYTGNAGAWTQISVDEELGLAYLPVESATGDYYGGHRPGANLFAETLVAVDLKTGRRKWHFQLVHHGIWDHDISSAPILADVAVNGRPVKVVALPTKQAFLYVFNRETGEPIWPIEERPVPKGDVPGEWYSPTQPFPTKPPAYDRQGLVEDDLIDFTPELRAEALKLAARYKLGPIFTPPVVSRIDGPLATLAMATAGGGTNWPGGSYDPDTHVVYVSSTRTISQLGLVPPDPAKNDMAFVQGNAATGARTTPGAGADAGPQGSSPRPAAPEGGGGAALTVQGLPLVKPPYGSISAISLDRGEILWQVAHGETPDNIRQHPALKGLTIPRTGRPNTVGTLVTKTLVIAGEAGFGPTPSGQRGAMLRAYDKSNGKEVGAVYIPAPQSGSPMTYMVNGRQHIVVAVSGPGYSGELVAFRLPREATKTASAAASAGEPVITPLIHSSVQVEHAGKVIQVDPWSLGDLSQAKPADLLLVTDDVGHHLDVKAIQQLRKPGAPVIVPASGKKLVPDGIVLANGQSTTAAGVQVEAIAAYDLTPGEPAHPKGEANGYLVTIGDKRLYFAGVTECVPEVRALKNIDVAFFPMNIPVNRMTPTATAECVRAVKPKIVYIYHYDQLYAGRVANPNAKPQQGINIESPDRGMQAFIDALKGEAIEVRRGAWYPARP